MAFLQYAVSFLFVLAVVIIIHELGHYWVARWCGVKVLRFSVGSNRVGAFRDPFRGLREDA